MCGIAGKLDPDASVEPEVLESMAMAMWHRGPDSGGAFLEPPIGMCARRLAIIDIAGGDQPVMNEDETIVVVMNGEIYNHPQLREQLIARGHRFRSRADTEVLVHLYEELGDGVVDQLRGMFAFALWDRRRQRLLCARDRLGKKPFFWAQQGRCFWFASELRALLQDPVFPREVDPRAIDAYLAFQCVPHPLAVLKGVRKLPPGSTLVIDQGRPRVDRYWSVDFSTKAPNASEAELAEELRRQLAEATRIRLISEVPLGAFLSGGVDSSAVLSAMAQQTSEAVKTFSIGFTERDFDELAYARVVARHFGTDHYEFTVEPDAIGILPKLARHYGEPFADPSAIPSFYLAELTSRHVTVALNGDGGDELFAGYPRYVGNQLASSASLLPRAARRPLVSLVGALPRRGSNDGPRRRALRIAETAGMRPSARYATWLSAFDSDQRLRLTTKEFQAGLGGWRSDDLIIDAWERATASNRIGRMQELDINAYLPDDLLTKVDIATMAYSVEARSPFLDHQLVEFVASLPARYKLHRFQSKRLLKLAMKGVVPDEILNRSKMGFEVPLASWFRGELKQLPHDVLLDPATLARGYCRREEVSQLISEHQSGARDHALRIWTLIALEMWHREVLESPPT